MEFFKFIFCLLLVGYPSAGAIRLGLRGSLHDAETRTVPAFNAISAFNGVAVTYTQGDTQSVQVTVTGAPNNALATTVVEGVLTIKVDSPTPLINAQLAVAITAPQVTKFTMQSAASISIASLTSQDPLSFSASSAGKVVVNQISANQVDLITSSAGSVDLKAGTIGTLTASASSAASISVYATVTTFGNVTCDISGSIDYNGDSKCASTPNPFPKCFPFCDGDTVNQPMDPNPNPDPVVPIIPVPKIPIIPVPEIPNFPVPNSKYICDGFPVCE